jgi:RNA polymerase sigma-70 factor, ECF subfamily
MADAQAFAAFYQATHRSLVAQLLAYTGDLEEAQDAAQEAYVRAWLRWRQVSTYDDPRAWVSRVGYHLVVSRWRRGRTALATMWRHGPGPAPREPDPTRPDLVAALKRLPEPQRRALVLFYLGGFAVNEIASTENAPTGTIKARLARGRQALATLLATTETVEVDNQ